MARPARWPWGTYFGIATYLGSSLKTGDLVVRFGVAILLFFVIPGAFQVLIHYRRNTPAA